MEHLNPAEWSQDLFNYMSYVIDNKSFCGAFTEATVYARAHTLETTQFSYSSRKLSPCSKLRGILLK